MLGCLGGSGRPGGDSAKSISFLEVGSFSKVIFFGKVGSLRFIHLSEVTGNLALYYLGVVPIILQRFVDSQLFEGLTDGSTTVMEDVNVCGISGLTGPTYVWIIWGVKIWIFILA